MKKILAIAVATAISAPAMADLTIGGSAEYNYANAEGTTTGSLETNLDITASATAENGTFVKAYTQLEMINGGDASFASTTANPSGLDIDDNYLQLGNSAAALTVGYFGTKAAWLAGDDSWAPTATVAGYSANTLDDGGDKEFALDITAIENLAVQISGNYTSGAAKDYTVYAAYTAGDVVIAANLEEDKGADATSGYAVSASTTMGGVALSAAYAQNQVDGSARSASTILNVGYDAISASVRYNDVADTNETLVYGSYNVGNLGVAGLNVDVGAGYGSESATKSVMGVEVTYAF